MKGYHKKVLAIELAKKRAVEIPLDEELLAKYVGGSGLGTKFLMDRADGDTDPLGEGNPLIMMTGPFTTTHIPTSSRHSVLFKSPLTNIYAESSCGGFFADELKKAAMTASSSAGNPRDLSIFGSIDLSGRKRHVQFLGFHGAGHHWADYF